MVFIRAQNYRFGHLYLIIGLLSGVALSRDTTIINEKRNRHLRNVETPLDENAVSSLKNILPLPSSLEQIRKATAALIEEMDEEELENRSLVTAKKGVTLTHIVKIQSDTIDYHFTINGDNCYGKDAFGDSSCHFDWGETISGTTEAIANTTVDEGYVAEVIYQVFVFGSWMVYEGKTACPPCSTRNIGSCYLGTPENAPFDFTMIELLYEPPPCPHTETTNFNLTFNEMLPAQSPFSYPVILQNTYILKNDRGEVLAETVMSFETN